MPNEDEGGIPNCYLCLKRPASPRKSHFTPASATEDIFGRRNKEEVYAISPHQGKIDSYFGRENLKNNDPTLKKDLNTEPYVFCKECEENLSKVEGKVVPALNKAKEDLREGIISTRRTGRFQKYFELPIHPKLVSLYFYSVVWRQAFQQLYDGQDEIFSKEIYEKLRAAVAQLIEMEEPQILASSMLSELPNLMCFTTVHDTSLSDFVNPNTIVSNPELFFVGAYDCLIFNNRVDSSNFKRATGLKIDVQDKDLYLNQIPQAKIQVIPKGHWEQKRAIFVNRQVDIFMRELSMKVASNKKINPLIARKLIHEKAYSISRVTGREYGECVTEAYHILMGIRGEVK